MTLPIIVLDNIIRDDLILSLKKLNNFKKSTIKDLSGTPLGLSSQIRRREIVLDSKDVDQSLIKIFEDANASYNFNLNYSNCEFRIVKYSAEDAGQMGWHDDIYYDDPSNTNALTLIIGLDCDYEGGGLDIENRLEDFKITKNTGIIFPSNLKHRVCMVTKGVRTVLVGWIRFA